MIDLHVNMVNHKPPNHEQLMQQYPKLLMQQYTKLLHCIDKLKDVQINLHINKQVKPVAQSARRIPFRLRKQVEKQLDQLEQQGIIKKGEGSTPWVSPLVIIPKKGEARMCGYEDGQQSHRASTSPHSNHG